MYSMPLCKKGGEPWFHRFEHKCPLCAVRAVCRLPIATSAWRARTAHKDLEN